MSEESKLPEKVENILLKEENRKLRKFLVDLQLAFHQLHKKLLEMGSK